MTNPATLGATQAHRDEAPSWPLATLTLIALNVLIFLWDRHWHPFGPSITFADLAMRPREVVNAVTVRADLFPLVTVFTSMFLHGSVSHIFGNLMFLYVFGSGIEEAFGSFRFCLYYIMWGIVAAAAQIWVDPYSMVPTLGASGAIGGVLGAFFLTYPARRVELLIPFLSGIEIPAWILLGLWFLYQIFVHQDGVANWAHAGGFFAGMVTVLVLGGRTQILATSGLDFEDY